MSGTPEKPEQAPAQASGEPEPSKKRPIHVTTQAELSPSLQNSISAGTVYYQNTDQTLILVSQDKLELAFQDQAPRYARRAGWIAPLGILLAFGAALVTTSFRRALLSADTWQTLFLLGAVLSFIWLICEVVRSLKTPMRLEVTEAFVKKVRGTGPAKTPIEFV